MSASMKFNVRDKIYESKKNVSNTESVDMLLSDMRLWEFKDLTKDKLNEILQGNSFSISRAVKMELNRILNKEE